MKNVMAKFHPVRRLLRGKTFVENLRAAGVEAGLDVYEGLYHAFDMLQPKKEISKLAIERFEKAFEDARKNCFADNN